jgi:site-specific recombinase XerD
MRSVIIYKRRKVFSTYSQCLFERYNKSFNETHFAQETIEDVNYSQIRSWIVALVDGGMSNVSVNRKVASLKRFISFC